MTEAIWGDNAPDADGWTRPSPEIIDGLNAEGEALTIRLQERLGPAVYVEYQPI